MIKNKGEKTMENIKEKIEQFVAELDGKIESIRLVIADRGVLGIDQRQALRNAESMSKAFFQKNYKKCGFTFQGQNVVFFGYDERESKSEKN